jgi:maleate isomerase
MTMQTTLHPNARPANFGLRARLGMMLPSSNTIAEPQFAAMLPAGVSMHATRLRMSTAAHALSMLDRLEEAALLLEDAGVDRIIFHCTAVSMHAPEMPGEIRRRVAAVTPIPLTITSDALIEAFGVLGARRVVLISPYDQATNDREVAFLAHHGITVLRERGLGCASGLEMGAVEPERWVRETLALRDPGADAYFISCTTIRSTDAIDELERELGKPVVTSNQGMLWSALRAAGIVAPLPGYGRLLRDF